MSKIKIGMAGWHERDGLYPRGCRSPIEKLWFYAQEFPIAEVDSTYYAIPSQEVTRRWVRHTPDGFVFNVKAFRLFTAHHTQPQALPPHVLRELSADLANRHYVHYSDVPPSLRNSLWEDFVRMLKPFGITNKLGVVLFQFAPWFRPLRESFDHILECKRQLSNYRIAVEFRNRWWLHPDYFEHTLGFLRDNEIEYVAVDEPQGFDSSVPPLAEVIGRLGVIRFHGRNDATWEKKGLKSSTQRFDYYYSPDEMDEWVPRIKSMQERAHEVHVIMNTNNGDQGTYNGRLLSRLLGEGLKQQSSLF
ncbi:MAG: DUF72 domain-containing protein [Dehalococcoidia bacterium]|nr:DUF72 domain-containing protein [Dehalococcoidia bacterium]